MCSHCYTPSNNCFEQSLPSCGYAIKQPRTLERSQLSIIICKTCSRQFVYPVPQRSTPGFNHNHDIIPSVNALVQARMTV